MGLYLLVGFIIYAVQLAGVPLNIELHISLRHILPEYYCVRYVYCNYCQPDDRESL